jgi:hypothetical protein
LKLHRACVAQLFQVQIKCWTLKRFTPWLKP